LSLLQQGSGAGLLGSDTVQLSLLREDFFLLEHPPASGIIVSAPPPPQELGESVETLQHAELFFDTGVIAGMGCFLCGVVH
jgi:hypothetical protein